MKVPIAALSVTFQTNLFLSIKAYPSFLIVLI